MAMQGRGPLALPDDLIEERTGRSSEDWYVLLDAWGAPGKGHAATVAELTQVFGLSERWANIVAIRYEAARDLQEETTTPADLITALILKPALRVKFEQLDASEHRAICRWIEAAEDKAERAQRIRETVEQLAAMP